MSEWDDAGVSQRIRTLRAYRVRDVLLVSTPFDSFVLEADGRLSDRLSGEYLALNLSAPPQMTRASRGAEALERLRDGHFDLVITMSRVSDMHPDQFARQVKAIAPRTPVVLLARDEEEAALVPPEAAGPFDGVFVWRGDDRLLLTMVNAVEDALSVGHDTQSGMVRVILLVEDSPSEYSTLMPVIYAETMQQTQRLMADGLNHLDRVYRMRARPKVLLARTFEQAQRLYREFRDYALGVISDVEIPRAGASDPRGGIALARAMRAGKPDLPILLWSAAPEHEATADALSIAFVDKYSPQVHERIEAFLRGGLGFGDFVFRSPDGREIDRATSIREMRGALARVPDDSLRYHGEHNHISTWLMARSEFPLAMELQPRRVAEFETLAALRAYVVDAFDRCLERQQRGRITEFTRESDHLVRDFERLGQGSLGGKGRGIAFLYTALTNGELSERFGGVKMTVPRTTVVCTGEFDRFLDENNLLERAVAATDDASVDHMFATALLPAELRDDLRALLVDVHYPLAVRSSSLLEDSHFRPFAGVYSTYMLPNNHPELHVRLRQLEQALKMVYASTFRTGAKAYMRAIKRRLEEEKMAVIIQRLVGTPHGPRYYPTFSGVAQSFNYYPIRPQRPEDGIALVALGLGRTVVSGHQVLRFSPRHPRSLPQMSSTKEALKNSQRHFFALDMTTSTLPIDADDTVTLVQPDLEMAEEDGTLAPIGATYAPQNDRIYDTVHRAGVRLVNFAPILKYGRFPLCEILEDVLAMCRRSMGCAVQIEFAVDLDAPVPEFAALQLRPLVTDEAEPGADVDGVEPQNVVLRSERALGNGRLRNLTDVVLVPPDSFDALQTLAIAREVGEVNAALAAEGRRYVLIGPGRWGTADRHLGIPVKWPQVSAAKLIVELALADYDVDPSQGTHFFHNITSLRVGYLTIDARRPTESIDWGWLLGQPTAGRYRFVRHLRPSEPLEARLDGVSGRCVLFRSPAEPDEAIELL